MIPEITRVWPPSPQRWRSVLRHWGKMERMNVRAIVRHASDEGASSLRKLFDAE